MDLDQAMHLERDGDGFVVHYAIADVMAFLDPGDPVDVEAQRRGESLYGGSTKIPLHPQGAQRRGGVAAAGRGAARVPLDDPTRPPRRDP